MRTYVYRNGLGHVYNVPEDCLERFEYRRAILLRIVVIGKVFVLMCVLYFAWTH